MLLPLNALAQDDAAPAMARIITQNEKPPQCLSRVHIQRIDGELVNVHPSGFEIEAGKHTMNGRAMVNTTFCRRISGRTSEGIPDLEAEFEAGKTYYVGLDHSSKSSNDWRLVIWKVEPRDGEPAEKG
jgi:hypothetical protein